MCYEPDITNRVLEPSVFMEVKPGPFTAIEPEDFAPWSPENDAAEIQRLMSFYRTAAVGDSFSPLS